MTDTNTTTTTSYPEPSPELIADIRKRLAELPPDVARYIDEKLKEEPIERVANHLWRTGHGVFMLSELYEYRRTLFPPNAMVEPYTAGPPVVRNSPEAGEGVEGRVPMPADSVPESTRATDGARLATAESQQSNSEPQTANPEPPTANSEPPPPLATDNGPLTTGSALLTDLRDILKRYVVLPEMAAETLALWVVHTYAFTLRQVTTYIGVVSPEKRCGKTTLLELLARLANRSLSAANISPSAMFRVIQDTQPTLLIDEADTFLQGRDELAGILNAGYRKGNSYVVRVADRKANHNPGRPSYTSPTNDEGANPGGTSYTSPTTGGTTKVGGTSYTSPTIHTSPHSNTTPEFAEWTNDLPPSPSSNNPSIHYSTNPAIHPSRNPTILAKYSCWCPKVMAAIGHLPDTLADRCIIITMQRKMPGEKCERLRHLNAEDLRKRCAEFVRNHTDEIAEAQPDMPSTLNDRAADIWEPLLAIADLAGGDWPDLARQAAQKLSTHDDELTPTGYFLKDLRNLMVLTNVDRMLCRDIVKRMNPLHDRPWEDLRRGREINEWWLGRLLNELGIRSRTMRVNDAMGKGYALADIDAAYRRYVPNPDLHTTIPPSSSIPNSAGSETSAPEMDAQTEKDLLKLMQQLMTPPKPS